MREWKFSSNRESKHIEFTQLKCFILLWNAAFSNFPTWGCCRLQGLGSSARCVQSREGGSEKFFALTPPAHLHFHFVLPGGRFELPIYRNK
jgi:hypothetical protein